RIIYTRDLNQKLLHTYGPFAASKYNKFEVYKLIQKLFPLRKCQQLQKKKCIYYDLGQCLGPCINEIKQSQYEEVVKNVDDFFKGKYKTILDELKEKEKRLSDNFEFEQAQDVNKLIIGITNIKDNQVINISDKHAIDVVGYAVEGKYISIVVFSYAKGKLLAKTQQIAELNDELEEVVSSYLVQFYLNNATSPKKVYLSINKKIIKELSQVLSIAFTTPEKGKFKDILINASINAKEYFKNNYYQFLKQQELNQDAFDKLKQVLNLPNLNIIHMFDMSNLFSDAKVGAMIALENGSFNKKLYRKFIIKDLKNAGDTQYMKECVIRQYNNVIKNNEPLPNLIIADGGWNQVNAIKNALREINLDQVIPVIGLAKNKNHQTEYIVCENKQIIRLEKDSNLYLYLLKIQDETHRFAISFFRQKKQSSLFRSQLNEIEGVGSKTIDKLLKVYQN
ncbi:MAG: excinuclease ABC subunit C, partial [Malacoplasma sp.]|nr:excinuclease ABC subunit C [Malacoplasma sp.]